MGRTEKERVDQTEQAEPQKHPQQTHGSTKKCIKKDATSAPPTLSNFQKSKGCTQVAKFAREMPKSLSGNHSELVNHM
jgi:hypothetical protein